MELEEYLSLKEDYEIYINESKQAKLDAHDFQEYAELAKDLQLFKQSIQYEKKAIESRQYARLREEQADKLLNKILNLKEELIQSQLSEEEIISNEIPF